MSVGEGALRGLLHPGEVPTVADVMTRDVLCIPAELRARDLAAWFLQNGVSGAPVVHEARVVGVVSIIDVLYGMAEGRSDAVPPSEFYLSPGSRPPSTLELFVTSPRTHVFADLRVRDLMTTKLLTASSGDPIVDAGRMMITRRLHRLLVTEGDRLVGVVSVLDLLAGFLQPTDMAMGE